MLSHGEALERFLTDGRIEIDPTLSSVPSDPKQLRGRTVYSPEVPLARHTAHLMMTL